MSKTFDRAGETWTREEVRTLRSIFRSRPNSEVAQILDRSEKAVERKAAKLGLTKNKKYLRSLGRKV